MFLFLFSGDEPYGFFNFLIRVIGSLEIPIRMNLNLVILKIIINQLLSRLCLLDLYHIRLTFVKRQTYAYRGGDILLRISQKDFIFVNIDPPSPVSFVRP